jgi:hypothetical protein
MSTTPISAPEGQAEIGAVSRMAGALVNSKRTFADIARRPTWLAPFLVLSLLSVIVGGLLGQKTDWRSFFERQMSQNSRFDQMPQSQKDQILESQVKYAPKISFVFGLIGVASVILMVALVYWGAFNLFTGAGLGFKASFGIASHAFLPSIIGSLLAIVILLIKPRGDVDPEHFLASSVAAFLPDGSPHWLESLGQSLELFWIWTLALVAIGFSAANPKKIKPTGAFLTVFGIWGVWVLGKVVWAML